MEGLTWEKVVEESLIKSLEAIKVDLPKHCPA